MLASTLLPRQYLPTHTPLPGHTPVQPDAPTQAQADKAQADAPAPGSWNLPAQYALTR